MKGVLFLDLINRKRNRLRLNRVLNILVIFKKNIYKIM